MMLKFDRSTVLLGKKGQQTGSNLSNESQISKGAIKLGNSKAVVPFIKSFFTMPTSIITTDDLREFKIEILEDIRKILSQHQGSGLKRYLKSHEVMDLLQISPGTLQNLRINGTLPYSKVGGIIFYNAEEIQKVMEENRIYNRF